MEDRVVPIHATILPEQRAMLLQLAKDEGMTNVSEALRRVLHEWRQFRALRDGFESEPCNGNGVKQ